MSQRVLAGMFIVSSMLWTHVRLCPISDPTSCQTMTSVTCLDANVCTQHAQLYRSDLEVNTINFWTLANVKTHQYKFHPPPPSGTRPLSHPTWQTRFHKYRRTHTGTYIYRFRGFPGFLHFFGTRGDFHCPVKVMPSFDPRPSAMKTTGFRGSVHAHSGHNPNQNRRTSKFRRMEFPLFDTSQWYELFNGINYKL